ncbi:MAG: acetyl-CoA carboxylase biotin carboxyl carrier protein [Cyanobacteria bacterium J06638_20]
MELNWLELRELLSAMNQTDIAELSLKGSDFELTIRRGASGTTVSSNGSDLAVLPPTTTIAPAPAPQPAQAPPPAATPHSNDRLVDVVAPVVGTFYRSPSPDDEAFVNTGDRIRTGQVVCIIEAMKIMNEIEAEVSGEVVEILVENAEPVEFGQVLMRVNPA